LAVCMGRVEREEVRLPCRCWFPRLLELTDRAQPQVAPPSERWPRMAVRIKCITFDCADPYRLAHFWSRLTGFSEDPDNGNAPDDPEALLLSPDGSLALLFITVPEPRHVKNR